MPVLGSQTGGIRFVAPAVGALISYGSNGKKRGGKVHQLITTGVDGLPIKIPSGASVSQGINMLGGDLTMVFTPAGWDTAALSPEGSIDGTTWFTIDSSASNVPLVLSSAPPVAVAINVKFGTSGWPFLCPPQIRLRSGTLASPVNQTADRVFKLMAEVPS